MHKRARIAAVTYQLNRGRNRAQGIERLTALVSADNACVYSDIDSLVGMGYRSADKCRPPLIAAASRNTFFISFPSPDAASEQPAFTGFGKECRYSRFRCEPNAVASAFEFFPIDRVNRLLSFSD